MYSVEEIDDNLKHIFREHNPEEDHLANLGNEGKTKTTIDGVKKAEKWKAVSSRRVTTEVERMQRLRCRGQHRQGEVDHNQLSCSAVASMHSHGIGIYGSQRID